MNISTKGRYGLRAMVDIAVHSFGDYIPLKIIAERQAISENYLEQVFSILRKAKLVKSARGSQGGYTLSTEASKITVGEVLRILEGDLNIAGDVDGASGLDNNIKVCIDTIVWQEVNKQINKVMDSVTLQDLVEKYKSLNSEYTLDFII
ncbi:RrF2 family transcriptional regulator [Clostridium estertheticum]|uniref:Rrf2 family transcriptional regulator n=2 Tax=Clostridium estertheticum TaxID=238834 RepID=A0A1J0GHC2_9CLOT|nr:Rrf2 family transcriptional regulator [Clostridium estertheticum]APC40715.1 Rrf2 family transcriptional regulator [Clostridium estertheticum subsp. estertheticum]MBU3074313.1 Rrf2 family transcriptional regulator [Clostridium estertheticum]MBU3164407.1 Rrf2 family transcriptional regulator [Clostridium estertheticum]MBU3170942.1 Rrf2 family transcriptional regulator [Clostridium estertheticum]MBU3184414.1 Rrf2 family transcriptional regulator [Clostridium estertheticum]